VVFSLLCCGETPGLYSHLLDSEGSNNHRPSPYLQQRFSSREADSDDPRNRRQPASRQGSVFSDLGSESSYKTVKSSFYSNLTHRKVANIQIISSTLPLDISTSRFVQIPTHPRPTSRLHMVSLFSRDVFAAELENLRFLSVFQE
jgi:hypothetical protein